MKECKYCRTKYDDSLTACPNCGGTRVVTAEELAEEAEIKRQEVEYREKANAAPELHKKRLIGILTAVVAMIIAVIVIISINANKPLSNGMTKDESEEIFSTGMEYFDNGHYEEAIQCFAQLPTDSKQYKKAQSVLTKSAESYRKTILEKVNTYVQNNEYEVALEVLKNAQAILPDDTEIKNAYNTTFNSYKSLIRENTIAEADAYVADGDYVSAIKAVNTALDKIEQDEELSAKLSVYMSSYKESLFANAHSAYLNNGYEEAISILQDGKSLLGQDDDLLQLISDYQDCKPISLKDLNCVYTSTDGFTEWNIEAKMMGELYTDYNNVLWQKDGYIDYELSGEYKRISGTLVFNGNLDFDAFAWDIQPENFTPTIKIYCDNNLIATYSVSNSNRSVDFECNIEGTKFLRIEVDGLEEWNGYMLQNYYLVGAISNFNIYKNVIE